MVISSRTPEKNFSGVVEETQFSVPFSNQNRPFYQKWSKMTKNGQKWQKMTKNDKKLIKKRVKNRKNWWKFRPQNWWKMASRGKPSLSVHVIGKPSVSVHAILRFRGKPVLSVHEFFQKKGSKKHENWEKVIKYRISRLEENQAYRSTDIMDLGQRRKNVKKGSKMDRKWAKKWHFWGGVKKG